MTLSDITNPVCLGQPKPVNFQPCFNYVEGCRSRVQSHSYSEPLQSQRSHQPLLAQFAPNESSLSGVGDNTEAEGGEKRPRETTSAKIANHHVQLARYPGTGGVYRWEYGQWTQCSASCSGGKQRSTLKCMDIESNTTVHTQHCDAKQKPIELTRSCNKQACPPEWELTEWSPCSHTCGGGLRTRQSIPLFRSVP